DTVPVLIKTINALIEKGDKSKEKSDQFYIAAGQRLKELKARKPPNSVWAVYVEERVKLSRSRADELIAIADNRTTVAETRAVKAASMSVSRANKAAQRPPRGGGINSFDEDMSDEATLEKGFIFRANYAVTCAVYDGPRTELAIKAAQDAANAWAKLVRK